MESNQPLQNSPDPPSEAQARSSLCARDLVDQKSIIGGECCSSSQSKNLQSPSQSRTRATGDGTSTTHLPFFSQARTSSGTDGDTFPSCKLSQSVIDDEYVLLEAIQARHIVDKANAAIATGKFPTIEELGKRLEETSKRLLAMSPEEKLGELPNLREIRTKLHNEQKALSRQCLGPEESSSRSTLPTEAPPVFISYTGKDTVAAMYAAPLSFLLEKVGVPNFCDVSSLRIGELWEVEIERNVVECNVFLCVLSPTYPFRKWCMHELDIALWNKKKILPVCVGIEPYEVSDVFLSNFYEAHRDEGIHDSTIQQWEDNLRNLSRIHAARGWSTNQNVFSDLNNRVVEAILEKLRRPSQLPLSSPSSPSRQPVLKTRELSSLAKDVNNRISAMQQESPGRYRAAGLQRMGSSRRFRNNNGGVGSHPREVVATKMGSSDKHIPVVAALALNFKDQVCGYGGPQRSELNRQTPIANAQLLVDQTPTTAAEEELVCLAREWHGMAPLMKCAKTIQKRRKKQRNGNTTAILL